MTDAAWMQIAPILQAVAVIISAAALWRANGAKKAAELGVRKTDEQTVKIDVATEAAKRAEQNTNGNLDKLRARLDRMTEEYLLAAKEHSRQLAEIARAPALVQVPGGRRADDAIKKAEHGPETATPATD